MAARSLAREGHDVVVVEEHDSVGSPVHCTGVLGLDAFGELDLPRGPMCGVLGAARFWAAEGASILVESEPIRAAIIDRGQFDDGLAQQAKSAGAEIRTGSRVIRLDADAGGVRVRVARQPSTIAARACVLACGANYRFNLQLGLGTPRAFVQSAQIETAFPLHDSVEVYLENALAPGGFAWLVPFVRNGASFAKIGLMCTSRARRHFDLFTERLAATLVTDREAWPRPRLKMLPLAPVRKTYATRVLAVGDAAGLVKPTTGGGIYYSLLSGQWAAETLSDALRHDMVTARALGRYEQRWRDRLGPEIRAGLAFRTIAAWLDDRAIGALIELAKVDGLIPLLKRTANFNWHRDAALALLRNGAFRRAVVSSLWG
jgi:geranylgeranyl reductase family protein